MIDAVVRQSVEEAIGFLTPGDEYTCSIDEHVITFVRVRTSAKSAIDRRYVVICIDCRAALELDVEHRRAFLAAHRHTSEGAPKP